MRCKRATPRGRRRGGPCRQALSGGADPAPQLRSGDNGRQGLQGIAPVGCCVAWISGTAARQGCRPAPRREAHPRHRQRAVSTPSSLPPCPASRATHPSQLCLHPTAATPNPNGSLGLQLPTRPAIPPTNKGRQRTEEKTRAARRGEGAGRLADERGDPSLGRPTVRGRTEGPPVPAVPASS